MCWTVRQCTRRVALRGCVTDVTDVVHPLRDTLAAPCCLPRRRGHSPCRRVAYHGAGDRAHVVVLPNTALVTAAVSSRCLPRRQGPSPCHRVAYHDAGDRARVIVLPTTTPGTQPVSSCCLPRRRAQSPSHVITVFKWELDREETLMMSNASL